MFRKQKGGIITGEEYAYQSDLNHLIKKINAIVEELDIKFCLFSFYGPTIDKEKKNKIDILTERIEKIEKDLVIKEIERSGDKKIFHLAIKKIKDIFKQKLNIDPDNLEYRFEEKLIEKEVKDKIKQNQ